MPFGETLSSIKKSTVTIDQNTSVGTKKKLFFFS